MHRRPLGRGRLLASLGAIVILVGSALPWYSTGGGAGELPARTLHAFDGSGFLSFVAALGLLALVALPYAAVDRPVAVDRWLSFALLALLAFVGVLLWPVNLLGDLAAGLLPDRAYGYWIAVVGVLMVCRAAYEIRLEPDRRY
ncbi:MAG TPA: hypothetical protein VFS32_08670 [Candidatus Limnocylindrales bacterium]|nr:hypothetical protein [Candidatus Limnocylindrales bacterium]